jgi:hypothetical protein
MFWGLGHTGSYHQYLFATNTIMLDGLEIGFDWRLDNELRWQLPAQGAIRLTMGIFSTLDYFHFFICISPTLLCMTLVHILFMGI